MLRSERVYLRRLERTDLERTWTWMHRPDIYEKIGVQVPFSTSQQSVWFENMERTENKLVFAVCLCENDEHVGNVSLDMIDQRHRNARLSVFIADPAQRGHGIGSEALRLLVKYAFDFLNLHKVWCKANAADQRVLQFYERAGFRKEGTLVEHEFHEGKYIDKCVFGIIRQVPGAKQQ
ncbi:MAG TPA: hypothetical protein DD670_12850 [Planctomycetaceae bacterium]|nr:hypothetical protein [Planctomycetaceae bacterium]